MIETVKTIVGLIVFALLANFLGFSAGMKAGVEKAELQAAREAQAVEVATRDLQAKLNRQASESAATETQRQTAVKEIRRETERIIERPVYRTVCVDADGVRNLDQAADLANAKAGDGIAPFADAAAGTAETAPQHMTPSSSEAVGHMTAADCVQSMLDLYDTAGQIRAQLVALQSQVTLTQEARPE